MPAQLQLPGFPSPFYPSPFSVRPWYPLHMPLNSATSVNSQPQIMPAIPTLANKVDYPNICEWLQYCDQHSEYSGKNFTELIGKFDQEGYRCINQLTRTCMSVEKLSDWLGIGKGTADLIIGYVEEDIELVKAEKFSMIFPDDVISGQGLGITEMSCFHELEVTHIVPLNLCLAF